MSLLGHINIHYEKIIIFATEVATIILSLSNTSRYLYSLNVIGQITGIAKVAPDTLILYMISYIQCNSHATRCHLFAFIVHVTFSHKPQWMNNKPTWLFI